MGHTCPHTSHGSERARQRAQLRAQAMRLKVPSDTDVCIVGAGAAGLTCAIAAAEAGAHVVALERDLNAGRTILATGNGRCNFCNTDLAAENYNHPAFVSAAMGTANTMRDRILTFFRESGLAWIAEDGRLYPRSRQAASVRNVLLARARKAGVMFACARTVTQLWPTDSGWQVSYTQQKITSSHTSSPQTDVLHATSIVLATGGGLSTCVEQLAIPYIPAAPILCALAARGCTPNLLTRLDGRRAHCVARLVCKGRVIYQEPGEILFRRFGLSGIVAFNLSRHILPHDTVELDLAPEIDVRTIVQLIAAHPGEAEALDGILDPIIAASLIECGGGIASDGIAWRVAPLVKSLPFHIEGCADTSHAQVTRGGLDIRQVNPDTLGITSYPHLFACGEALDIDGACGGYNLAWAWASGMQAGEAAAYAARSART